MFHRAVTIGTVGQPDHQLQVLGWPQFLRLALPNFLMISEWWAAEIIVLLAGTLPGAEVSLTAMSIFSNTCRLDLPSG